MSVGFAVTGNAFNRKVEDLQHPRDELQLILTKPIGTGVIMAANMQMRASSSWVDAAIKNMRHSNESAAEIFIENDVLAATDVTGFGLARHAQNLASRLANTGCVINLSNLPLLDGVTQLFGDGIASSLHGQNRLAINLCDSAVTSVTRFESLFDPQTSGGLLKLIRQIYV